MTRAAERRNITQPAFSRRIRNLEAWLGAPVIERGANRVDLSAALIGNEAEIRAMLARLTELRSKISNFEQGNSTITIAAQHAPVFSTFADLALNARTVFPGVRFRLRPANLRDCVTIFLRRDASILMFYEADNMAPLPFGDSVLRTVWGKDRLVPVIGAGMVHLLDSDGTVPQGLPAIVYPDDSYFGETLLKAEKPFGTRAFTRLPICETAFSAGTKELVLSGLGIAWLPDRMCEEELRSGALISLENQLGALALDVVFYADRHDDLSCRLIQLWAGQTSAIPM